MKNSMYVCVYFWGTWGTIAVALGWRGLRLFPIFYLFPKILGNSKKPWPFFPRYLFPKNGEQFPIFFILGNS